MFWLSHTYKTPEMNLACDEFLLNRCENEDSGSLLRFWDADGIFAVLGISNKAGSELNLKRVEADGIKVLRRISGGGTVLQFPGCLNYSLFLRIRDYPELKNVVTTNKWVMQQTADAINEIHPGVEVRGFTDLTLDGLKFSGNAQRRMKHYCLFHGTLLLDVDFEAVENYLAHPSKEPEYRKSRKHSDFITHISLNKELLQLTLRKKWNADTLMPKPSENDLENLIKEKYSNEEWNFKW